MEYKAAQLRDPNQTLIPHPGGVLKEREVRALIVEDEAEEAFQASVDEKVYARKLASGVPLEDLLVSDGPTGPGARESFFSAREVVNIPSPKRAQSKRVIRRYETK